MSKEKELQELVTDRNSCNENLEDGEISDLVPQMSVNVPAKVDDKEDNLIEDETLLNLYDEILVNLRGDRKELDDILSNFLNMVINEGDATTSSKEAVVNLLKIKTDTADKMTKIADLMTRIKMKDRDTFPRYLAAHQNNTINIGDGSKRALLEAINKAKKESTRKEGS